MTGLGDFAKAEALAERGQTYYSGGQYAEAWAEFNHAVELQPNLGWAIYGRGEASRMLGRYIEALTDFTRAIELIPERADGYASRGETYRMLERYDEARADFNQALKLDPNYDFAIKARDKLPRMTYEEATPTSRLAGNIASGIRAADGGKCFIATEIYGDDSKEVAILRHVRDRDLLPNSLGRPLVALYYRVSPSIIPLMRRSTVVRIPIRALVAISVFLADWCKRRS
jgi:tetratricopeptide (TPR) repeat protein